MNHSISIEVTPANSDRLLAFLQECPVSIELFVPNIGKHWDEHGFIEGRFAGNFSFGMYGIVYQCDFWNLFTYRNTIKEYSHFIGSTIPLHMNYEDVALITETLKEIEKG